QVRRDVLAQDVRAEVAVRPVLEGHVGARLAGDGGGRDLVQGVDVDAGAAVGGRAFVDGAGDGAILVGRGRAQGAHRLRAHRLRVDRHERVRAELARGVDG